MRNHLHLHLHRFSHHTDVTGRLGVAYPTGYVDMLFLRFKSSSAGWTIGPTESVEFRGTGMFFSDRTDPVARFEGAWAVNGERCPTVECRSMLSLQFEDQAGRIEPVVGLRTSFYLRGTYAFAGRERIAKLDPLTGLWNQTNTQKHWPRMRVIPARPVG